MNEIAQKILDLAEVHYTEGGWDVLVECHDAASLVDLIWGVDPDLPVTFEAAYDEVVGLVEIWADRQADARNSAF